MTKRQKKDLYKIIASALLFALCFILDKVMKIYGIIYLIPYGIIAYDVLKTAVINIIHGQIFDENFLMAVASIGALFMKNYPEAVAVMLFYEIGELFEKIAVGKSRNSISSLMSLRPDTATVLVDGQEEELDADEISVGDVLVIRPGERIAVDGRVIFGSANIDTSALTGESLPGAVTVGDEALSGCVVLDGMIKLEATCENGESTVSRILDMVESSTLNKAKSEDFITKFARWYTPCVVISAIVIALVPVVFHGEAFIDWIHRALMFLVVSCPCALVVSIPLTYFGAIGGASKKGILFKGSNYLETLNEVTTAVFDKTRTLTTGEFCIEKTAPVGITEQELINIAASAERFSSHPLAVAIKNAATENIESSELCELSGRGIKAETILGTVYAGNKRLMSELNIAVSDDENSTCIYVAVNGQYKGAIYLSDTVKVSTKAALSELKSIGIEKTVMLTGDNKTTAKKVGNELNIDEIYSDLLPEDKVSCLEDIMKSSKGKVLYVGDGINDAPVLVRADVGISMGALGSDAAMEASDIVLMHDDICSIAYAMHLSRKTHKIVSENIFFALSVKFLILILSALGITTNMWLAVFADVGVLILAILNAIRTMR